MKTIYKVVVSNGTKEVNVLVSSLSCAERIENELEGPSLDVLVKEVMLLEDGDIEEISKIAKLEFLGGGKFGIQ